MSQEFYVGFARADISPTICSVPLGGFGATEYRLSGVIGDPLYVNAVVIRSGEETLLYLSLDMLGVLAKHVKVYREAVSEKTGIPTDRIFITASHTHSGPCPRSEIPNAVKYRNEQLIPTLVDAAYRALVDLKPAKLSYGSIEVGSPNIRMNFDRHYYVVEKGKEDNYTEEDKHFADFTQPDYWRNPDYVFVEHLEKQDPMLQILRFARDGADDVILFNFAAHATFVGTPKGALVSADWPGAAVRRIEEVFPGTKCAFLQGCAGNLVPETRIESEIILGLTGNGPKCDPRAYASVIAGYVRRLLLRYMKDSESTDLTVRHEFVTYKYDHSKDHLSEKAEEALARFRKEGHTPAALEFCRSMGFGNVHSCGGIAKRARYPESDEIELNAIRIGDCGIATIPFEPYSSIGLYIKEHSPFAMTIANGYCCGYHSYLPTLKAHPDCYEWAQMPFVPGTAEAIGEKLSEMLQSLK